MTRLLLRRRLRPLFMAAIAGLVITEIVALSPSSLEERAEKSAALDPETLVSDEVTLATGIPKGRISEYRVDQFQYVSTQGTEKQWKLVADKAFLYNKERIVHARKVRAYLYDPEGKITVVTGKEAKYIMNGRDLELYGDVHTVFPDGFELQSDYLRHRPAARMIEIPNQYFVRGGGQEKDGQDIRFESHGMDYSMATGQIILPETVRLTFNKARKTRDPSSASSSEGPTVIEADRAVIFRNKQVAQFTMSPRRPIGKRFVRITQPTMFSQGRRAELSYGEDSKILEYLLVFEDVLIQDTGKPTKAELSSLRYATGGKAEFDSRTDVIRLTDFPQVYQDNDTVTGDVIVLHRDTDLVEVEHSNAFSQGT